MNMSLLRCPVCHLPLEKEANTFRCSSSHTFDVAREGYINLLLSHRKKSKEPGDNKEMLLSRRRFLQAAHFDVLIERLCELFSASTATKSDCAALDLGCGEGYFLRSIASCMNLDTKYWGVDVAKSAMQMAAKVDKRCDYAVATNSDLPFQDKSFDVVFSINAPVYESEITRILKDDGMYVRLAPAGNHLLELKKLIYKESRPHDEGVTAFESLQHIRRDIVDFEISLSVGEAYDLLSMTPYYWHASEEAQAQVKNLKSLVSPASFSIDIYRKK